MNNMGRAVQKQSAKMLSPGLQERQFDVTAFKQMVSTFSRVKVQKCKSWDEISTFVIFLLAIGIIP